jgi:hypothetical protein
MLELFRQCGMLLFVSVSVIFDWMLELFRQCDILVFVSISVIFDWMLELKYHIVGTAPASNQKS